MHESALIGLVGLRQHAVRLQAVAEVDGGVAQPAWIQLLGRGDQDLLGLALPLLSQLRSRPGDQSGVRVADLAGSKGGLGQRQG